MSPDDDIRRLASEALPRVSPELALVDASMAAGLRRRERILDRRRPVPFQVLHAGPAAEAPPRFPGDDPAPHAA